MQHRSNLRALLLSAALLMLIALGAPQVLAKDLTNRMGIGYSNQFSTDLPSIAVKYFPSADLGLTGTLGINTGASTSKFGFLAKVHRTVFSEDNMNFYMGGGAGLLSNKVGDKNESGFELIGFAGGEFFFTGLESLGFSFETGVGVVSVTSGVTFRTIGDSPFKAAVIFYF